MKGIRCATRTPTRAFPRWHPSSPRPTVVGVVVFWGAAAGSASLVAKPVPHRNSLALLAHCAQNRERRVAGWAKESVWTATAFVIAPGRIRGQRLSVGLLFAFFLVALVGSGCDHLGPGLGKSSLEAQYRLADAWPRAGEKPFHEPFGIAVAPGGENIVVSDARGGSVLVLAATNGALVREIGAGTLRRPTGVAVGPDGTVYVSDYELDAIFRFDAEGRIQSSWHGPYPQYFDAPSGLVVSGTSVYVADFYHKVIHILDREGKPTGKLGHPGQWGPGALDYPTDVETLPSAHLLVADAYNHRLVLFREDGRPAGTWGYHLLGVIPRPASGSRGFRIPTGIAAGPDGLVHVADSGNSRIVLLDRKGRFVTDWKLSRPKDSFHTPVNVAVHPHGKRVYATDIANQRILVLEVVR